MSKMDTATYDSGSCKLRFPHLLIIGGKIGAIEEPQYYINSARLEFIEESYYDFFCGSETKMNTKQVGVYNS